MTVLLQIFSNYVIASWAGHNAGGLDSVIAIQSPIDQFIPWFTPMIIVQFIEDASWFIILPLTAWLVGGSKSVFKYFSVSLMIYIFGTIFF
ncbi:MAG: hypothetical protein LBM27_05365, partial [Lactobacillaceae bacterium]|nr:hypothetical protein [Lactobacillaceae bacterium]